MYNCNCFRCGKPFTSENEDDQFDTKCLACITASAEIAAKVDAQIRLNRSNNPALPQIDEFQPTARQGNSGFMGIRERVVN